MPLRTFYHSQNHDTSVKKKSSDAYRKGLDRNRKRFDYFCDHLYFDVFITSLVCSVTLFWFCPPLILIFFPFPYVSSFFFLSSIPPFIIRITIILITIRAWQFVNWLESSMTSGFISMTSQHTTPSFIKTRINRNPFIIPTTIPILILHFFTSPFISKVALLWHDFSFHILKSISCKGYSS